MQLNPAVPEFVHSTQRPLARVIPEQRGQIIHEYFCLFLLFIFNFWNRSEISYFLNTMFSAQ